MDSADAVLLRWVRVRRDLAGTTSPSVYGSVDVVSNAAFRMRDT